ncbi:H-type lectin domain-containing protein [Brevirhabdus sp.]|uniref:H-type lectin domain-containing protein n=1 Tax=Brevirhabdus sp. TaxID=2004514 RepID=UPI004058A4FB
MRRFSSSVIGAEQGEVILFSDFDSDGPMWSETGPRLSRTSVGFSEPFAIAPMIHVSLAMWDIGGATNQRADISTDNITAEGFDIVFRSWGDTRVARIRASWMAVGEVPAADEEWDLY